MNFNITCDFPVLQPTKNGRIMAIDVIVLKVIFVMSSWPGEDELALRHKSDKSNRGIA